MDDLRMSVLETYRLDIPRGSENARGYDYFVKKWDKTRRSVRRILHDISVNEFDDGFVLIRSAHDGGMFYLTKTKDEIARYRKEIINKARSLAEPARIIDKVLEIDAGSLTVVNRMRKTRLKKGMKQTEVVEAMRKKFRTFDVPMLSKMENGVCLPTPPHLVTLARIYGVEPSELLELGYDSAASVA